METKNLSRTAKAVMALNDIYKKASKKEKKRLILEDTLRLIRTSKNLKIDTGAYLSTPFWTHELVNQQVLLEDEITCQVCARGAMMCSKVRIANNFEKDSDDIYQEDTADVLQDAFSLLELSIIETFFERSFDYLYDSNVLIPNKYQFLLKEENDGYGDYKYQYTLINFLDKYYPGTPSERLTKICKNIIKADCNVQKALLDPLVAYIKKQK